MAGYRKAGVGQFTNATTINDQMDRQREEYQGRPENAGSERGIARDTTQLFSNMPDDIFSSSVNVFEELDNFALRGNPDFQTGANLSSLGAGEFVNMFSDVENRIDKPNKKGPNLVAPNINNLSEETSTQQTSQFNERGFGWRDGRNEPATETARIGTYFSRHYNAEGAPENKPILGEAKSPEDDQNIEYNQPII
jgi:hypothetical protein